MGTDHDNREIKLLALAHKLEEIIEQNGKEEGFKFLDTEARPRYNLTENEQIRICWLAGTIHAKNALIKRVYNEKL